MDSVDRSNGSGEVADVCMREQTNLKKYLLSLPLDLDVQSDWQVLQFNHGQSNPTYLVVCNGRKLVVRKQPPGKLLQSAHAVDREYRVMKALQDTCVPVPRVLALCKDANVIGTEFFVMEYVQGRIFQDVGLPLLRAEDRCRVYHAKAKVLASLHSLDVDRIGLGNYGPREDYCIRQIRRWKKQYLASVSSRHQDMLDLARWLEGNCSSSSSKVCLLHGDYRLDNILFQEHGTEPLAVVDWELSTLGDPWSDVAYMCLGYHLLKVPGLPFLPKPLPEGIPTEAELLELYCQLAGREAPTKKEWIFYLGLGLFRVCSIVAGVGARAAKGNASAANAAELGASANKLASYALRLVMSVQQLDAPARSLGSGAASCMLLRLKLEHFMENKVYPAEPTLYAHALTEERWTIHPLMENLKQEAQRSGLWNLWMPADTAEGLSKLGLEDKWIGPRLTNEEYAPLCEIMGRSVWGPEVFNCNAPDTGNMEILARYGTQAQQRQWLVPLLQGRIRSCFGMTEPQVASSDATNISSEIRIKGNECLVEGTKWWTSGAMDPRCKLCIFMGKSDKGNALIHKQQSMVLIPMDSPGVRVIRPLTVFGYDDAPHGHAEVEFKNVILDAEDAILLGAGRGFEIAQGRLGPGRLHHCMRLIGMAERSLELMVQRGKSRVAFGKPLAALGSFAGQLAECRIQLNAARLLVVQAAKVLDREGFKGAKGDIAAAKVAAPRAALRCIDQAMQVHGGAGVCQDTILPSLWAAARTLRIADGPDEVHLATLAKMELRFTRSML